LAAKVLVAADTPNRHRASTLL